MPPTPEVAPALGTACPHLGQSDGRGGNAPLAGGLPLPEVEGWVAVTLAE
jgi:hypothetical protein